MNLTNIGQKTKETLYGDQSLSPSTINKSTWTTFGTMVIQPKGNCIPVQRFLDSCLVYDKTTDEFNEEIDFPSASYIKKTFDYVSINPIGLEGIVTLDASRKNVVSLLYVDTLTNENIAKILLDVNIKSLKSEIETNYKIEVEFNDNFVDGLREKIIKITPRKLNIDIERADYYLTDSTQPQFYDMNADTNDQFTDLVMLLPAMIGEDVEIKVTIEDCFLSNTDESDNIEVWVLGNQVNEETWTFENENFDPLLTEIDELSTGFLQTPQFEVFVMDDHLVDMFGQYMVMTSNFTGDEAQVGAEQTSAYRTFNLDVKTFPTTLFEYIPEEFKTLDGCDSSNSVRNRLNSRSVNRMLKTKRY